MEDEGDATTASAEFWRVGRNGISANDLALISLEHVSKNSWQVHLQLLQPIEDQTPET